jgi:hypothetical protein
LSRPRLKLVVNIRETDAYDVYIGRGSKWGNPFELRDYAYDRDYVLELYERHLMQSPELLASLHELTGKVLGCYCAPKKCHGDILVRLANNVIAVGALKRRAERMAA